MQIKIGASPLSWMNSDFPSLGSHISVDHCLSELSLIGYQGVELEDPFRKVMDRLPQLLLSRKLNLIGGWHALRLLENPLGKELQELDEHLELLQRLGADVAIIADCSFTVHRDRSCPLSKRPYLSESDWGKLCDHLEKVAERVAQAGMFSAYHHHMGTVVQSGSDVDRLMQGTEKLGLLFDTGHFVYAGEDPHAVLDRHLSRVTHVHCKNVRPTVLAEQLQKDSSFIDAILAGVFTVPGDQQDAATPLIDFSYLIEKLLQGNYRGWVVMEAEQDPGKADPYTYAHLGYSTIHSLLVHHLFHQV